MREHHAGVLRPVIVPLSILRRRIVEGVEVLVEFLVRALRRIVHDLDNLDVAGATRAHLLVRRELALPRRFGPHEPHRRGADASRALRLQVVREEGLRSPVAARAEGGAVQVAVGPGQRRELRLGGSRGGPGLARDAEIRRDAAGDVAHDGDEDREEER